MFKIYVNLFFIVAKIYLILLLSIQNIIMLLSKQNRKIELKIEYKT